MATIFASSTPNLNTGRRAPRNQQQEKNTINIIHIINAGRIYDFDDNGIKYFQTSSGDRIVLDTKLFEASRLNNEYLFNDALQRYPFVKYARLGVLYYPNDDSKKLQGNLTEEVHKKICKFYNKEFGMSIYDFLTADKKHNLLGLLGWKEGYCHPNAGTYKYKATNRKPHNR